LRNDIDKVGHVDERGEKNFYCVAGSVGKKIIKIKELYSKLN